MNHIEPSEVVILHIRTGNDVGSREALVLSVDPNPGGAFGMAIYTVGDVATFAAVDDNTNSLLMWTLDLN